MIATSTYLDADPLRQSAAGSLAGSDPDQLQKHLSQGDPCKQQAAAPPLSAGHAHIPVCETLIPAVLPAASASFADGSGTLCLPEGPVQREAGRNTILVPG